MTSKSQAVEVSVGEVKGCDIYPAGGPYKKTDLCSGLCCWQGEHCHPQPSTFVTCTQAGTGACDLEQDMCSTESKGQRVGHEMEKLRSHLHTAAQRASCGSLVHLSHLTASFCLFWLWEQLWFQMVSAPVRVPLSMLAHMFWLVLVRLAISSLAGQI